MEFTSEILQALSKRAWKLSWIIVLYAILSLFICLSIIVNKELYFLENFVILEKNYLELLKFFSESFLLSIIIFGIFYILKGDSDNALKKLRTKLYIKIKERVRLVFKYRYNFPRNKYSDEIRLLTEKIKTFKKNDEIHEIDISKLSFSIVNGIDSLYAIYKINDNEKILFSIWYPGNFIAIAIALNKSLTVLSRKEIKNKFENTLNLVDSVNSEDDRLSERDVYWWFDIKYNVTEEFLFNNIEKEQISRKVAHILTVGLPIGLELMGWKEKK
jgi:hypothetical protein